MSELHKLARRLEEKSQIERLKSDFLSEQDDYLMQFFNAADIEMKILTILAENGCKRLEDTVICGKPDSCICFRG